MVYIVKLHKGEFLRPSDLQQAREVSIKIASGTGWVTYKCSELDLVTKPGDVLNFDNNEPLIEALSSELNLEIFFNR